MPIRPSQPSYTVDEVVPLLGLGRHQLRGLVERRVITPSVTTGYRGPGGKRRFSRLDIVAIRSGCELMRLGLVGADRRLGLGGAAVRDGADGAIVAGGGCAG